MRRSWMLLPGRGFTRDGLEITVDLDREEIWDRLGDSGGVRERTGGRDVYTLPDGSGIRTHWHPDRRLDVLMLAGGSLRHDGVELLDARWSQVQAALGAAGLHVDDYSRRLQGHDCPGLRVCFVLPVHYGGADDDRIRHVEFWHWV